MSTDKELLKEALKHISNLIDDDVCAFASSRERRPEGETCREWRTWQQGVPCPGCFKCEAREFLARVKE